MVTRVEQLEHLEEDWRRLAEPSGHPFATWEWSALWWRHLKEDRTLRCFACRDEADEVLAILPLCEGGSRPRMSGFIGDGDLRSPICPPANRAIAAAGLQEVVRSGAGAPKLLLAERLPAGDGWAELVGGRRLAVHPDPAVPLEGVTWDEFLAARSRNFRQQVRRRERRLVEEHGLSFRLCTDPRTLDVDFAALVRLHALRWGEGTSGVFDGARGDFHREFAVAALDNGWLRLWIAEIADEPVAAWYGWRFAGSEWYYQAGRDPRFDDLSLGFVMLAHTIRAACEDGVDAYRFLDGAEPYKWRFASEDRGAESRLISAGPIAGATALGLAAAASAPAPLRRRLARARS